jgi:hypothetical protein
MRAMMPSVGSAHRRSAQPPAERKHDAHTHGAVSPIDDADCICGVCLEGWLVGWAS